MVKLKHMIANIKGKIKYMRGGAVVVDVQGIGYKIFTTPYTLGRIAGNTEEIEFYIHTYVREDTLALYGFLNLEELEMFELLISISKLPVPSCWCEASGWLFSSVEEE